MQVKFVVANAQVPLIGLHGMDFYEIAMHTGNEPYIGQYGYNEQIHSASQSQLIMGEVEDLSNQAYVPRQLRQPYQPSTIDMAEHRLTHMPYRSWCPICVKVKGNQGAIIDPSGLCLHQVNDRQQGQYGPYWA
eukprot:2862311-Amphidinium_carterae.9